MHADATVVEVAADADGGFADGVLVGLEAQALVGDELVFKSRAVHRLSLQEFPFRPLFDAEDGAAAHVAADGDEDGGE